ncbi:MAG: hypothetical protein RBR97_20505 [Bacteroidales bacterium]|nr:hypothetical protein [Bacteroidales bacterium]
MKIQNSILTILFFLIMTFCFGQEKKVLIETFGADSIVQIFYENGQLFYQVPYKEGKQNGWYEQYHENGSVWTKEYRVNGKTVDGYYFALHGNGNIYQKGFYKNGRQVGKWYCYTDEGKPFKIYIYDKDGNWTKLKVWNPEKEKWEKSGLY